MTTIEYKGIRICTKETFDTLKANNELIVGKQYLVVDETFPDYYSKAEIDDMIGDIDTALANILGV